MATIPTQIKQRFLVLLAELTGFDGKVLSGKLDVFETPTRVHARIDHGAFTTHSGRYL